MIVRGRVSHKRVALGSKSEHDALVLSTTDSKQYVLRRQGGNPFRDEKLEALDGKEIECEGIERDGQIIMTSWKIVG